MKRGLWYSNIIATRYRTYGISVCLLLFVSCPFPSVFCRVFPIQQFQYGHLHSLYTKYKEELITMHERAQQFCALPKPDGFPHAHRCQYSLAESELIYMLTREQRPTNVLEVCSAVGYTTMWMLSALHANGVGHLYGFDVYRTPWPAVLPDSYKSSFTFYQGDVHSEISNVLNVTFDRIILDADHTASFTTWYLGEIFDFFVSKAGKNPIRLSIHDIYHGDRSALTEEGALVLDWIHNKGTFHDINVSASMFNVFHQPGQHYELYQVRNSVFGEEIARTPYGGTIVFEELSAFVEIN